MASLASDPETPAQGGLAAVLEHVAADVATLDRELGEIDMLISQATTEAGRHEQKRAQVADRLAGLTASTSTPAADLADLNAQVLTLTRRAAVMESQVDVLEGKRKALGRFREALTGLTAQLSAVATGGVAEGGATVDADAALPPALSRVVLTAQEDLRREIARAMHDGPAQSLTNIVLQAQIVERLVGRDADAAQTEVQHLVSMVQQTLDATKSFIFDVRPMVLDDLGLVPTLRRAARDRGKRAAVAVDFDSIGADRRLPVDIESGLFRILDEALAAYLASAPDRVTLRLDWSDALEARIGASRGGGGPAQPEPDAQAEEAAGEAVPPALQAMMEDRRADRRKAAEAVRTAALVTLPDAAWRDIRHRAATIGVTAELLDGGSELRVRAELPPVQASPTGAG